MVECMSFGPWSTPVKEIMNLIGMKAGVVRSPLVMADKATMERPGKVVSELNTLNIFWIRNKHCQIGDPHQSQNGPRRTENSVNSLYVLVN
jgi:hypothetical protein